MVQTGGPLATLVGICLLGVVFAVPVSLLPIAAGAPHNPLTSSSSLVLALAVEKWRASVMVGTRGGAPCNCVASGFRPTLKTDSAAAKILHRFPS